MRIKECAAIVYSMNVYKWLYASPAVTNVHSISEHEVSLQIATAIVMHCIQQFFV